MKNQWTNNKGIFLIVAIFTFVLAIDLGLVYLYYRHVQNFLQTQPEKMKADAGIIFFGDYTEDYSDLGPDSKNRAKTAIQLFQEGKIKKIICVGGYNYLSWKGKPHLMRQFLEHNRIPASCIINDTISYNTITNWREALKIIEQERLTSVVAISSPLHVYRISCMVELSNINFASYTYSLQGFNEYWQLFLNVHHEWVSHFMSFAIKDDIRNKIVYSFGVLKHEIDKIL
jgi:vancomycin permeability regulator SanA